MECVFGNVIILINGKDNNQLSFGLICINAISAEFISVYTELREGYILLPCILKIRFYLKLDIHEAFATLDILSEIWLIISIVINLLN